jgi:hypothetical protein
MRHVFLLAAPALLIACGSAPEADLGEAPAPMEINNALTANALTANALAPGALTAGALAGRPLAAGALGPEEVAAIQDPGVAGDLSRRLLKYAVGCALDGTRSLSFSWTDGGGGVHDETYPGSLGLAAAWAEGSIDADVPAQEWVSACLAARTNWYGVTVTLSTRGNTPPLAAPDAGELADFPEEEGAFWGNVFSATPTLFACHDPPHDANSRGRHRDCAAGHINDDGSTSACGIIQLAGACGAVCAPLAGGVYHPSCGGSGRVVTVFLP